MIRFCITFSLAGLGIWLGLSCYGSWAWVAAIAALLAGCWPVADDKGRT